jgi:prenylcysteine oxidase/farnesylcysteine lyase
MRIVLWSLVFFPTLAFAFSWASLFGGSAAAADQHVIKGDDPEPPQPKALRIAVIGAGAAGSSAAFWINKAAERLDEEVIIDIYERSDYVGGSKSYVMFSFCLIHSMACYVALSTVASVVQLCLSKCLAPF